MTEFAEFTFSVLRNEPSTFQIACCRLTSPTIVCGTSFSASLSSAVAGLLNGCVVSLVTSHAYLVMACWPSMCHLWSIHFGFFLGVF